VLHKTACAFQHTHATTNTHTLLPTHTHNCQHTHTTCAFQHTHATTNTHTQLPTHTHNLRIPTHTHNYQCPHSIPYNTFHYNTFQLPVRPHGQCTLRQCARDCICGGGAYVVGAYVVGAHVMCVSVAHVCVSVAYVCVAHVCCSLHAHTTGCQCAIGTRQGARAHCQLAGGVHRERSRLYTLQHIQHIHYNTYNTYSTHYNTHCIQRSALVCTLCAHCNCMGMRCAFAQRPHLTQHLTHSTPSYRALYTTQHSILHVLHSTLH